MYFSRVRLEYDSMASKELFRILQGDSYSMHQLIWRLFPKNPHAKRDFLFRQEFEKEQLAFSGSRRGLPVFYVVSKRNPTPVTGLLSVETKPYDPKLTEGMVLSFETRVNPVVREKVERVNADEWKKSRKVRGLPEKEPTKLRRYHDVIMNAKRKAKAEVGTVPSDREQGIRDAVLGWLAHAGKRYGFDLVDPSRIEISAYKQESLRKRGNEPIRFSSVDLAGTLAVSDVAAFRSLLFSGFGNSRSFGCGLFMVRKL